MKHVFFLIGLTCLISACSNQSANREISNTAMPSSSCLDDLALSHKLTFDFGKWNYKPVPETDWMACMPENSTLDKGIWDVAYDFLQKHPDWIQGGMGTLKIPSESSSTWIYGALPDDNPSLDLILIPVTETWSGSVMDWVRKEFGGRFRNSDTCLTHAKTVHDYPPPDYVSFETPVLKTSSGKGESVRFEACLTTGASYAVLMNEHITLIKYGNNSREHHKPSEELIQRILQNLHLQERNSPSPSSSENALSSESSSSVSNELSKDWKFAHFASLPFDLPVPDTAWPTINPGTVEISNIAPEIKWNVVKQKKEDRYFRFEIYSRACNSTAADCIKDFCGFDTAPDHSQLRLESSSNGIEVLRLSTICKRNFSYFLHLRNSLHPVQSSIYQNQQGELIMRQILTHARVTTSSQITSPANPN